MSEGQKQDICARAVALARRHVHLGLLNDLERGAAELVLQREGLTAAERARFWSEFDNEAGHVDRALATDDASWRHYAEQRIRFEIEEDRIGRADVRTPGETTLEKIRELLYGLDAWPRLPARRQTQVDALWVDAAMATLREIAAKRPLWVDLRLLLKESDDSGWGSFESLRRAALAAGRAVAVLLPTSQTSTVLPLLREVSADKPDVDRLYSYRVGLRYRDVLRRGSAERRAARLAEDTLVHVAQAAGGGDLVEHVPAAWEAAHAALVAAFDGAALAERRQALRHAVLAALPAWMWAELGLSEDERRLLNEAQRNSVPAHGEAA